ncbi:hypothetical protein [Rodentibacter genomosp. 1]|nr:hypothetical protein [Rodentibacter genomosp. 1]
MITLNGSHIESPPILHKTETDCKVFIQKYTKSAVIFPIVSKSKQDGK